MVPSRASSAYSRLVVNLRKEVVLSLQRKGRGGKIIAWPRAHGLVKPFLDYLYFYLPCHGFLPLVITSLRSRGHAWSFNICQDRGGEGAVEQW